MTTTIHGGPGLRDEVTSCAQLEGVVGGRPVGVLMKSLDALDGHCIRLLALCTFAVLGYRDAQGEARITAIGGPRGFAEVLDPSHLRLASAGPLALAEAAGCGLLCFVPGLGETLRINGTLHRRDGAVVLAVEEAFVHCAKALLRSGFWGDGPAEPPLAPGPAPRTGPLADPGVFARLSRAPFVALASWDGRGAADVSPKGDPRGFLRIDPAGRIAVPDRPGNRRTDTMHNALEQPRVALLALDPGDDHVVEVTATARITTEPELLRSMAVAGKVPKIALVLAVQSARVERSEAIVAAGLWDRARHVPAAELPVMAAVFRDHVRLDRRRGVAATLVRTLASERLLGAALAHDYKRNLY